MFLIVAAVAPVAAYVIPAVISAAAAIGASIYSAVKTKQNNDTMLDYNKSMTQQSWERDDKYFQRSVADAEAAGLSPLAVNGAMPNTSPLSAPNLQQAQAPQFDMNALIQAFSAMNQTAETSRHNKATEDATNTKLQNDAQQLKLEADKLELEDKKLEQQIKYQSELVELQSKQLAETSRKNASEYELKRLSYVSSEIEKSIKEATGGKDIPTVRIYNREEYETKFALWTSRNKEFISNLGLTSQAQGTGENGSFGVNAGAGVPLTASGNVGFNKASGESQYTVENQSQRIDEQIRHFYMSDPLPVFIPYDYDSGKSYSDF